MSCLAKDMLQVSMFLNKQSSPKYWDFIALRKLISVIPSYQMCSIPYAIINAVKTTINVKWIAICITNIHANLTNTHRGQLINQLFTHVR